MRLRLSIPSCLISLSATRCGQHPAKKSMTKGVLSHMKSRSARISICLLLSVLTIAWAHAQFNSQGRTSYSASPASSQGQKRPSGGLKHELQASHTFRVQPMANPPVTKIGFLSSTQIPAGPSCTLNWTQYPNCSTTGSQYTAVLGDFLGDGNQEVADVVQTHHPLAVAIAVELPGTGGAFNPTLTPVTTVPNTELDPILVGKLTSSGPDDLVMIHYLSGNYEVFVSNMDGTFTSKG